VIAHALSSERGTPAETFTEEDRTADTAMLGDGEHAHAICEEYRTAAGVDRDHGAEDRRKRRRITCPVLALWSARGPLSSWYSAPGGPLAIWRDSLMTSRADRSRAGTSFLRNTPIKPQ
jgi:haloacetate dehalogenase